MILGIDTSCYTTSVAVCRGGEILHDLRSPLNVAEGNRGLRQSEGLFMHTKALPELFFRLAEKIDLKELRGVAVSTKPRPEEGSYMPVFLAGYSVAKSVACALSIPLFETSHQEGHVMAALASCGEKVKENEFISLHISGGTTEILRTYPSDNGFSLSLEGGSLDLHAGQLIDRVGVAMGMKFPCGSELDKLAMSVEESIKLPVTLKGTSFHLSGAEAQAMKLLEKGCNTGKLARGVLETIALSIKKSLDVLYKDRPFETVVAAGGVTASRVMRETLKSKNYRVLFADPRFSTDNACGVAFLGEKVIK